jgi:Zn-dependent peptidase ImmA (M78 family)
MTELTDPHIEIAVAAADELRAKLGLAQTDPFTLDLLECVEGQLGLGVCILDMPRKVAGAYIRRGRRSLVFIQAENYPTRQRFTIAHELGHHTLGHGAVFEGYADIGRDTSDHREQQANYFASELLHPVAAVQGWLTRTLGDGNPPTLLDVVRMADVFHVSPPAMLYRLSKGEFAGIDRGVLDPLWEQCKGEQHIELSEQHDIGHGSDAISRIYEQGPRPRLPDGLEGALAEKISADVRNCFPSTALGSDDAVAEPRSENEPAL